MISIDQLEATAPTLELDSPRPRGTLTANPSGKGATRGVVGPILNSLLADEFALHAATLDYHWNVTGLEFYTLHQLVEEQYRWLGEKLDQIARHARAVGVEIHASWRELSSAARISAAPGASLGADQMVAELIALHESVVAQLGRDLAALPPTGADAGTADFLAGLINGHERSVWTLRGLLESESAGPGLDSPAGAICSPRSSAPR